MFLKLVKHELHELLRVLLPIFGGLLLFAGVTRGLIWLMQQNDNPILSVTGGMFIGLFFMSCVACVILTAVLLLVRFAKSVHGDEGYLTHTLPVTSTQLLVAKIVTGGTCLLLLTVLLYVMVGGLAVFGIAVATHVSMGEFLKNVAHFMRETISVLETEVGISLTGSWIYIIAALVLSPFANVMILFGALTLGQLSWKNKGLMGVVAYIVIRVVMNLISSVLSFGYQFYALAKRDEAGLEYAMGLTNGKNFVTLGIMLLFALALLFTSNFVVKNRLNLE